MRRRLKYLPASRRPWFIFMGALSAAAAGCGPQRGSAPPAGWPQQLGRLEFYDTPAAFIYAPSAPAAAEADRLVRKVARDLRDEQQEPPPKAVVMICASTGELPVGDPRSQYMLSQRASAAPDQAGETGDAALEQRWETIKTCLDAQGLDPATEMPLRCLVLDGRALREVLGLPPEALETADWAVQLPTRTLIERTCRDLMNAKLTHRGTGPLEVVAKAPMLVIEESRMVNNAAVNRDIVLFTEWARRRGAWEPAKRDELVQAYTQRKLDEAMFPVFTALRDTVVDVGEAVAEPLTPADKARSEAPK